MTKFKQERQKLIIEVDTAKMTEAQIRLIKTLTSTLPEVILTHEESVFFEESAEFMRMCASLIQQSRFAEGLKTVNEIPYAEQALEYSIDILQEHMEKSKVVNYDN